MGPSKENCNNLLLSLSTKSITGFPVYGMTEYRLSTMMEAFMASNFPKPVSGTGVLQSRNPIATRSSTAVDFPVRRSLVRLRCGSPEDQKEAMRNGLITMEDVEMAVAEGMHLNPFELAVAEDFRNDFEVQARTGFDCVLEKKFLKRVGFDQKEAMWNGLITMEDFEMAVAKDWIKLLFLFPCSSFSQVGVS
ncbi:hypothetical protein HHK36_026064 [Tetracentron sinense]|uniref:Uncharacterized protein n=1 Tax=Tetracentron sinense TaxID=13715 RepID=A0A834YI25_TETSI|nr:hypothetical protein HHK36_026064 [Tetracentron sinense]